MKCRTVTVIKSYVAGILAAIAAGIIVGCGVKSLCQCKTPKIKKGAKKALRTVERYIDNMM